MDARPLDQAIQEEFADRGLVKGYVLSVEWASHDDPDVTVLTQLGRDINGDQLTPWQAIGYLRVALLNAERETVRETREHDDGDPE